jgi:MbtH protein
MEERENNRIYKVVVNQEEQYSIWVADREPPLGWKEVGKTGPKAECLVYIKEVWTDMRSLSLRKKMQETEKNKQRKRKILRFRAKFFTQRDNS